MTDHPPVPHVSSTGNEAPLHGWALISVLAGIMLTLFLSSLDATIVGTALPRIVSDLHGFDQYSWVVTAYLLTSTTVVPIVGKLSDQFGRKWFLLTGIALFLLGSALAGTSQTMTQLILFRGLQGLGAGFMQVLVFTLVGDMFSPAERGRWQGIFVSVFTLASIIGPAIGGWLTDHTSWRWVFYVNLPVGILTLIMLTIWLPSTLSVRNASSQGWAVVRRIDITGVLFAAAATVCLLLGLTWGAATYAWDSVQVTSMLIAAGVLYLVFLINERVAAEPLLPLDLFRNQVFAASGLLALTLGMVAYAMIFYLPLFVQGVLGQTATSSGAAIIPLTITLAIISGLSGQVIAKVGRYKFIAVIGATILPFGIFLLTRMDTTTALWTVTLNMIVVGVGMGMLQPIYTLAAQNAIPNQRMGAGTGAITYLRAMGSMIGTAVLGALVAQSVTGERATRQVLAINIEHVYLVTFGVGLAVFVVTLFLKDVRLRKRGEEVLARTMPSATEPSAESNAVRK